MNRVNTNLHARLDLALSFALGLLRENANQDWTAKEIIDEAFLMSKLFIEKGLQLEEEVSIPVAEREVQEKIAFDDLMSRIKFEKDSGNIDRLVEMDIAHMIKTGKLENIDENVMPDLIESLRAKWRQSNNLAKAAETTAKDIMKEFG